MCESLEAPSGFETEMEILQTTAEAAARHGISDTVLETMRRPNDSRQFELTRGIPAKFV